MNCVGFEKKLEHKYIQKVCSLFKMDASLEKYFLSQVQPHPTPIHVLIGLRDQTLSKIPLERFITDSGNQLTHSWLAPAISFYKGGMTDQIVIAGPLGNNGTPTRLIPKSPSTAKIAILPRQKL